MFQIIFTAIISILVNTNIYTINFSGNSGASRSFKEFQGKKILIVNMASASSYASQLAQLDQLQQQYADSLAIVVFPSNSFGNEPKTDIEISNMAQYSFIMSQKGEVKGPNQLPVFQWLTTKALNGYLDIPIRGDFQKYLMDKSGSILGVFASGVSPLDPAIINAIKAN